ncbi:hypothetical protein G6F42_015527 [Rhizopus arrhizus]|nr:hypothetical protein G6F42_015527 [Rhizopus arrhizus]
MDTILEDFLRSLKYYSKVSQAKKYRIHGFFEGHVSSTIDTAVRHTEAESKVPGASSRTIANNLEQQKQLHAANTAAVAAKSTGSSKISNFSLDGYVNNTSWSECSADSLAPKDAPSSLALCMQVDHPEPNATTMSAATSPMMQNGRFKTSVVLQSRHLASSTSMSKTQTYQNAYRA